MSNISNIGAIELIIILGCCLALVAIAGIITVIIIFAQRQKTNNPPFQEVEIQDGKKETEIQSETENRNVSTPPPGNESMSGENN